MPPYQPEPKVRRKVPIPPELRESLREVFDLIEQERHDPDLNLDFDDAIQVGAVCGGRYGTKLRPYVLTYYPSGDPKCGRWFLTLHPTEIEDIADGRLGEITMYCCASDVCRCKFREKDDTCPICDVGDEERQLKARLESLSEEIKTKQAWVGMYVRQYPNATAGSLIGHYNSMEGLGDRCGWFTYEEAQEMIEAAKSTG